MSAYNSWDDFRSVLAQAQQARADEDELRAHTLYVRATQLDPNNATAWTGRAEMSFDPDDAMVAWGYTLSLMPSSPEARVKLASRVQERLASSRAGDERDLIDLGRDLAQAGQRSFAYQLFERATELAPNAAEGWIWRAGVSESPLQTVADLNQALALEPENVQAQAGMRWVLAQKIAPKQFASPGMVRQAAQQIDEGRKQVTAGDKTSAYEFFARATQLDHTSEAAWLWRASTTTNVDEALMCLEQGLVLNPSNAATQGARQRLRERKLGKVREPIAPATAPVAPIGLPTGIAKSNSHTGLLLLAIVTVVAILLFYLLLKNLGYIP